MTTVSDRFIQVHKLQIPFIIDDGYVDDYVEVVRNDRAPEQIVCEMLLGYMLEVDEDVRMINPLLVGYRCSLDTFNKIKEEYEKEFWKYYNVGGEAYNEVLATE